MTHFPFSVGGEGYLLLIIIPSNPSTRISARGPWTLVDLQSAVLLPLTNSRFFVSVLHANLTRSPEDYCLHLILLSLDYYSVKRYQHLICVHIKAVETTYGGGLVLFP